MHRFVPFMLGLIAAAIALPQVLSHHARAELMQLAWCGPAGSAAPGASPLFGMHCAACPLLVSALAVMLLSLALPSRWLQPLTRTAQPPQ